MDFNRKHGKHIAYDSVAKIINKFKKNGSVVDHQRSGRPRTSTDEGTTDVVLAHTLPYVWRLLGHPLAVEVDSRKADTLHLLHVDSCGEEDVCLLVIMDGLYIQEGEKCSRMSCEENRTGTLSNVHEVTSQGITCFILFYFFTTCSGSV
ncbi:hypothetical protein PGIGA_G00048240 [Pangasianodon gigas]|uniref:Uncharacterized protein n=1 Tax=Pangasianodon gigas TaxID=30993 RepID=A0ACC5X288_PANGG|nr:hypothetical protein [Pangasianodon gigas]